MARFFGRLVAVPIRLLASVASLVRVFDPTSLWSACWKLSRDARDGGKLLVLMARKHGVASIRERAEEMLEEARDCRLAVTMGFIEFGYREDIELVDRWVRLAKEDGYKNPEFLLQLELVLSDFFDEYDREAVVEEILGRNDLPAQVTLGALVSKANGFLEKGLWFEAEGIAERILSIQEQPDARMIKWVTCTAGGEGARAEGHLRKAQAQMPSAVFEMLVARGRLFLGQTEKAMEHLCRVDTSALRLQRSKSPLGVLARSEAFAMFCREREDR
jgi:hypothetical protein